jgi:hypothetical protein
MENGFLSVRRERMNNQPKHFTPEEKVAAADQIVNFVRCRLERPRSASGG